MRRPDEVRTEPYKYIVISTIRKGRPLGSHIHRKFHVSGNTFQSRLQKDREHAELLWEKAVLANHIAKICNQPAVLYKRKGQYLSALRRMGLLYFTEAQMTEKGVLLSAGYRGGGRIHIGLEQLDPDVQERIAHVVVRLLTNPLQKFDGIAESSNQSIPQTTLLRKGA